MCLDTVLSYLLRNKPDLDDSSLLGCNTVVIKDVSVHSTEGKQREHRYSHTHSYLLLLSSFYWALVANGLNVLQPYWLIVLHLDVPALTASLLL